MMTRATGTARLHVSRSARPGAPMTALVWLVSFVIVVLTMSRNVSIYDEGIILTNALRVAAGDVVHRDFYANYGPASYYIVAAILELTGEQFFAARLFDACIKAAIGAVLFHIVGKISGRLIASAGVLACVLWFVAFDDSWLYPIYPCMLFGIIGTYLMIPTGREWRPGRLFIAGACAGLTALFRYEAGFFLLAANLAGAALLLALKQPRGLAARRFAAVTTIYGAGTALIFVPPALGYLATSPLGGFWHDVIEFPLHYYPLMRGLPFPGLWSRDAAGVYFAPLVAVLVALEAVRIARRPSRMSAAPPETRISQDETWAALILFTLCALAFFLKGAVRVSPLHMVMGNVPAIVALCILAGRWRDSVALGRVAAAGLIALVLLPAALFAIPQLRLDMAMPDRTPAGWGLQKIGLIASAPGPARCGAVPRLWGVRLDPDYARVTNYLSAYVQPDERILLGLNRHDRIFINPVMLYFASGRMPGTHWHHFDPGLQTRADVQTAIITDLKRNEVRWIVRDATFEDVREPNASAESSNVTLLDDYIDENYRPVAVAGRITIWLDKKVQPPATDPGRPCEAEPIS